MLEHGGRLRRAAETYGIALHEWLDLSTGISPWSWLDEHAIVLPREAWSRLPEDEDELGIAARAYYGTEALPVAGSQAAIQMLPRLRSPGRVGLLHPAYAEHALHWQRAGHEVIALTRAQCAGAAERFDALILTQPNNPDGQRFAREDLLDWHARLSARGGWLLVDEAFIDAEPELSLASACMPPGLIVLRSLGKFFGLAGARVGFVLAQLPLLHALRQALGPWTLAGPSRHVANLALRDRSWQAAQTLRLRAAADRLALLLRESELAPAGTCALFQWVPTTQAAAIHQALASLGILTRLFTDVPGLRFGLPGQDCDWQRLRRSLREIRRLAA